MPKSNYVIPFRALLRQIGLDEELKDGPIELTREQMFTLIRTLLDFAPIDEAWYRKTYPDVEQAIASGVTKSGKTHFVTNGYFEGRHHGPIKVDEEFYLSKYPDVAEGIKFGEITSAQEHFDQHGFIEGRLPYEL